MRRVGKETLRDNVFYGPLPLELSEERELLLSLEKELL